MFIFQRKFKIYTYLIYHMLIGEGEHREHMVCTPEKSLTKKVWKNLKDFAKPGVPPLSQHVHTNYSQQVLQPALGYKRY